MISILLPVYDWDIRPLVQELHRQCTDISVPFEIIAMEDGSQSPLIIRNQTVNALNHVQYSVSATNVGRSAMRNRLAAKATHDYLLFIDADHRINRPDYIANYLAHAKPHQVVCGGTAYAHEAPTDPAYLLHWTIGQAREAISASTRNQRTPTIFMSNNFLIPRSLFQSILFDERLKKYGHEDTLFGRELSQQNIPILHIDNPAQHLGIEPTERFLEKTKEAIYQLKTIETDLGISQLTRLQKLGQWIRWIPSSWLQPLQKHYYNQLLKTQSIKYWDRWRLLAYATSD